MANLSDIAQSGDTVDTTAKLERIHEIVNECLVRRTAGEVISDESIIAAHPDLMPQLAEWLAGLSLLDAVEKPVEPACIGRYRIEKLLGRGGFGRVFLAHDEQLDRLVAIKTPHRQLVGSPKQANAYLAEARMGANLVHPHIVTVYDVGSTDEFPCYMVCQYIEGSDLASKVKNAPLNHHEAAELVATVAEALHYAHTQGLVHRDVKPSNVLIDTDGVPYVADFGLALHEENLGQGPRYAGTPAYMSPEQAQGEGHRVDCRSDIFSLGAVLYELLAGCRPFRGETQTELFANLTAREPRRLRRYDDRIPPELERICQKALAKRIRNRYVTAKDFAEDLRHFLADQTATTNATTSDGCRSVTRQPTAGNPESTSASASGDSTTKKDAGSSVDRQPLKVVPKGLRSFDAHDADFFLELLSGPRDRGGLPESIRFWKTRIEESDAAKTFSVGLMYGPSGCGKSSLIKAGLLPQLSPDVIAVFVEATAEDTETRLLHRLRERCPALDTASNLQQSLASVREGCGITVGKKVLIVIDQFEQWLHAHRGEQNADLVQALRHCDGRHLQCIVMVRDDFWLASTRFMNALKIDLTEGQNTALVDLFDLNHARRVLAAFGRAFGRLPEQGQGQPTSRQQKDFLTKAVAGLAEEEKVVCLRLALFAEMMRGKPWNLATLKEAGGIEGLGVTFLEETFRAATAHPTHRRHQQAARRILKSLLPELGTNIRGRMKSYDELLQASGYSRHEEFDALLTVLDSELRLITPVERGGGWRVVGDESRVRGVEDDGSSTLSAAGSLAAGHGTDATMPCSDEGVSGGRAIRTDQSNTSVGSVDSSEHRGGPSEGSHQDPATHHSPRTARYYQLTHDYLVPSLRDWLTRKQRQTRRGRAEFQLSERGALWSAKPEDRYLPSLAECIRFATLTDKDDWTQSQRTMMKRACRVLGLRWGLALSALVVVGITMQLLLANARQTSLAERLRTTVDALAMSNGFSIPQCLEDLKAPNFARSQVVDRLRAKFAAEGTNHRKLSLAYGLAEFGIDEVEFLLAQVQADTHADEMENLLSALSRSDNSVLPAIHDEARKSALAKNWRRKARLANLAMHLGDLSLAQEMCQLGPDPVQRTIFVEQTAAWQGDVSEVAKFAAGINDAALKSGIALGVGSITADRLTPETKHAWQPIFADWYENDPDGGAHSAAGWVLRRWELSRPSMERVQDPAEGYAWHVNGVGMTMVRIPDGTFRHTDVPTFRGSKAMRHVIKDRTFKITRPFLIADREISVGLFQQFIDDPSYPANEKPAQWPGIENDYSPTHDHPVQQVNWSDSVLFCNWLSHKEGLLPCYERSGEMDPGIDYVGEGDQYSFRRSLFPPQVEVEFDRWHFIDNRDGYRLPTEAEWEYACRAGTSTEYSMGNYEFFGTEHEDTIAAVLGKYAVYRTDRLGVCGSKFPNGWGLFDMHGNVWEWCQEWYEPHPDEQVLINTIGPDHGESRPVRGGSFNVPALTVRSASRGNVISPTVRYGPYNGFRPVRTYP